jgi:hypothetical protein
MFGHGGEPVSTRWPTGCDHRALRALFNQNDQSFFNYIVVKITACAAGANNKMEPNGQLALERLQATILGRGNFAELKSLPLTIAAALYDRLDTMPPSDRPPEINAALVKAHHATPTPTEQNLPLGINVAKLAQVRTFIDALSGPQ